MKKFNSIFARLMAIVFLLFSFLLSHAQTTDSVQLELDHIFEHIDKSQIPTGFIDDYGTSFANLSTYNGVLTDSNKVDAIAWHYIYATAYSSKIYGTNTLPTPESNYTVFTNAATTNSSTPVSMLLLQYASFKPNAVADNLISISNDQLYDVPNRPQSPYQLNMAYAAAPFYSDCKTGTLSLLFK